ncbi:MAG: hypothetical protein AAF289_18355 [Cyanobacteria bacterium P01_A01_bin.135]
MSKHLRALGVFPNRTTTASALQALRDSGFSMTDTSVITREANREADIAGVEVTEKVGNQAETGGGIGAAAGGVLGGITGLLVGLGTIAIPGIGPALLAGEAATVLTTVIGAAGGAVAGSLVGALIGLGVPEHRAKEYSDRVSAGDYLLMLKGSEVDLNRAEQVLKQHNIQDWGIFDAKDGTVTSATAPDTRHDSPRPATDRTDHDRGPIASLRDAAGVGHSHSADRRRIIGVFPDWQTLETALDKMQGRGLDLNRVAIAVRDDKRNADYLTGGRGPRGGVTGMLSGLNRIEVPGTGSVLVVGPETTGLSRASRQGSVNSLANLLSHLGISEAQSSMYGQRITDGEVLVTLQGDADEAQEAASLMGQQGMRDWGVYDIRGDR